MPTKNLSRKDRQREQERRLYLLKVAQAQALELFREAHQQRVSLQKTLDAVARAIAEREQDDG